MIDDDIYDFIEEDLLEAPPDAYYKRPKKE